MMIRVTGKPIQVRIRPPERTPSRHPLTPSSLRIPLFPRVKIFHHVSFFCVRLSPVALVASDGGVAVGGGPGEHPRAFGLLVCLRHPVSRGRHSAGGGQVERCEALVLGVACGSRRPC
jgi:hypothetical protein